MTNFSSVNNKIPTVPENMNMPNQPDNKPGVSSVGLHELMEKNLKWSQIIYEQNRKINAKLLWMVIGSWFRVLLILAPLVLAVVYAPTIYRKFQEKYGALLQGVSAGGQANTASFQELFKVLPLSDLQREQLKGLIK